MDITKTNVAKKLISKFAEVDYKVVSAGKLNHGNENFVWTDKDYKDEKGINIGTTSVSDEVKEKEISNKQKFLVLILKFREQKSHTIQ